MEKVDFVKDWMNEWTHACINEPTAHEEKMNRRTTVRKKTMNEDMAQRMNEHMNKHMLEHVNEMMNKKSTRQWGTERKNESSSV